MKNTVKPAVVKMLNFLISHSIQLCVAVACALAAGSAKASTYYWKGATGDSSYGNWSDLFNWSTESASGADAAAAPGPTDKFYGLENRSIDLEGQEWSIGGWDSTGDWNRHKMYLRNGTLNVVGEVITHSDDIHLSDAKIVFAEKKYQSNSTVIFTPAENDAGEHCHYVHSGGEVDIFSMLRIYKYYLYVEYGGTAVIAPTKLYIRSDNGQQSFFQNDGGTLSMPNGLVFGSGSTSSDFRFSLVQNSGTLELGGPVSKGTYPGDFRVILSGGTVHATGDVSFDFSSATVPDGVSVTLDVDAGASIDLSSFAYGTGATVTKIGAGDFIFENGMTLPDTFVVSEGALALGSSGSYDLTGITFHTNGKVKIGSSGITLSAFDASIANATFAALDGYVPASGATVLTCADSSVLAQAQAGLNASLASVGISVEINGNSLVAESHYTFNSSTVSDMNDATGWVNNLAAPAGQPAIIAGSQTAAVMDGAVPVYSAIGVTDGATLTVVATRDLPATTLTAGTALSVASQGSTIVMEDRAYSDYILDTPTLVGTMSPLRDLAEITDISGKVGGGWFGNQDKLYTYVVTKVLDNGSRLHVQFIRNESDWTKCAIVDFTKDDQGNIYATGVGAGYIESTDAQVDFDAIEYNQAAYGSSDTSGAYGVKRLSFRAPVVYGGSATVTATGDFATTGSGSVTIDVAADCVLDLSGVDVTTEAGLVKTGDGTLVMGDELPTQLSVAAGALVLQPYVEYDMSGVTLGEDAKVKVAIDGTFKPAESKDAQSGKTIYMTGDTYIGAGGWDTLANWVSGELPDASAVVHVYGSETVLTLDAVPAAMPASIAVEGGATLKTATDVSLPTLTLDKQASLSIDSGITTLANGLVGVAVVDGGNVTLPALSIMDGATLSIPGGMNFSNVDIALYGTLYVSSMGKTTFGYAVSGETTYIGFRAEGGKIRLPSGGDYDDRRIGICCPQSGGRVVAVRDIVFKDMPTVGTHFPDWSHPDGFHLGVNNPADETFEVMFDNAKWGVDGNLYVYGGAAFRLRNGSSFVNSEEYGYWNRHAGVKGNGHIIVEGGCELRLNAMGNGGGTPFDVTVDQPGHEAVTVEDGGIFETFRWNGNANGVFSSSNGVLRIYNPRYDNAANNWHYVNEPFAKLSSVTLAKDSCLTLTTRNGSSSTGFKDASGPRVVAFANVPIVGDGGSVTLANANVNAFGIVVRSGANTATGSASVTAVDGTGATTLYFANGANWAGTVVAGNVALTNLTDGAAAATATFGSLDLAADFPIRVWKREGAYSADAINVGSFIDRGGKLTPVMMSEGEEFAKGDSFVVGKIAKDATLPAVAATGWALKTRPIDGDDAYDEIVLKFGVGLKIIVR